MTTLEKASVALCFLVLTFFLAQYQTINVYNHQSDTAMFLDVIENTARTGVPYTRVNAAVLEALPTWFMSDVNEVCTGDVIAPAYDNDRMQINQLTRHAYLIVYLLAPLTWIAPAIKSIPIAEAVAFTTIPLVVFLLLRILQTPVVPAAFFTLLTILHPAWGQSAFGQLYADRFFMIFALIYAALIHEVIGRGRPATRGIVMAIFACGLLAASTIERGALMIAGFTFAYSALYWPLSRRNRLTFPMVIFASALLIATIGYTQFINTSDENLGLAFNSLKTLNSVFTDQTLRVAIGSFLIINIGLYGFFALWNWRLLLIAFGAMLPNIVISGSLAFKVTFVTHYHSMYFPFLVFASLYGFHAFWEKARGSWNTIAATAVSGVLLMAAMASVTPSDNYVRFGYKSALETAPIRMVQPFLRRATSAEVFLADVKKQIQKEIPGGASVTTFERAMTALYHDHFLYYYPAGIGAADYALLSVAKAPDGTDYYAGAIGYRLDGVALDQCLTDRLRISGYDTEHPVRIWEFAILKRMPQQHRLR